MKATVLVLLCATCVSCGNEVPRRPVPVDPLGPLTTERGWTATNVWFAGVGTLRHDRTGRCFLLYYTNAVVETAPEVCR